MPKQNTDISGNPFAITYTAVGQKWTIAKGVDVLGTTAGVYSTFASSKLANKGDVGGGIVGVYFQLSNQFGNYQIDNQSKAEINGGTYGVYIENFLGSLEINNAGSITGSVVGVLAVGSTQMEVKNTGDISGSTYGMYLAASSAGAKGSVVDNYGKIESGAFGLAISGPSNIGAKLVNHDGGLIRGGTLAISDQSPLNFKNEGKVQGLVLTSFYEDKIINKKVIKGDVLLGSGGDTFKNKGNAKAGLIDTQDGNDLVVFGNKADKLLFDSTLNAATNVDTVKNFAAGKDAIYLDDDIFTTITPGTLSDAAFHKGTAAADADDRIIYDKASGALYYDPDGTGALAQTQFAKFDGGPKLKASDFTIGEYSIVI